jgi:hypothetical protein
VAPSALTKELRGRGANSAPCSLLLLLLRCAVRTRGDGIYNRNKRWLLGEEYQQGLFASA